MKKLQWPSLGIGGFKMYAQEIVDAIVSGFNGEHPKMLPEVQLLKSFEVPRRCRLLRDADLSLLSEVEYVGIQCRPFDKSSVEWTVKLINNATSLQVLILQICNVLNYGYSLATNLNYFCEQLATYRTFWSQFRILKIVPGILGKDELRDAYNTCGCT
jgi:hypothetical protein